LRFGQLRPGQVQAGFRRGDFAFCGHTRFVRRPA
jgi:hypothetical protein